VLLDRLPAPLHVGALRLADALRRRWWWLAWRLGGRPVRGCRVVVLDGDHRLLMIRHSYGQPHWTLPGGGMDRGEGALAAASREVAEECACRLADPVLLGLAADTISGARHEVHLVAGWTLDAPLPDGREIVEAGFFAIDALPARVSERLAADLPGYVTRAKAALPPPPRQG
jgi:ADP-ribose pyrophosphatase YjhB (NUDIX family)